MTCKECKHWDKTYLRELGRFQEYCHVLYEGGDIEKYGTLCHGKHFEPKKKLPEDEEAFLRGMENSPQMGFCVEKTEDMWRVRIFIGTYELTTNTYKQKKLAITEGQGLLKAIKTHIDNMKISLIHDVEVAVLTPLHALP
jgi:hypothetical protein